MNPSRIGGGAATSGRSLSQREIKLSVKGPTARSSVRRRPVSWTTAASSGHMSAARDARRSARCLRPSLRSDSSARSSAMSRFESGACTEEKLVRGQERHPDSLGIWPVRIVRELHSDMQISPCREPFPVDLQQQLAAGRRANVHEPSVVRAIGARSIDGRRAVVEVFDRHPAGRDPAMGAVDVDPVAIADRSMVNDGPTDPAARSSAKVTWVAALVVDDGRHHAPPLARKESFVMQGNEVNVLISHAAALAWSLSGRTSEQRSKIMLAVCTREIVDGGSHRLDFRPSPAATPYRTTNGGATYPGRPARCAGLPRSPRPGKS